MSQVNAQFPAKLQCLFKPSRYKILHGGRGSGKSWGVARALLILAAQKPMRVLCTREVQNSILESVHKLLSDQISELGLSAFYEIQKTTIKGRNGSQFILRACAPTSTASNRWRNRCLLGRRSGKGIRRIMARSHPDNPRRQLRNMGDVQSAPGDRPNLPAFYIQPAIWSRDRRSQLAR